jgi:murein L,D-transpeptidase YcbB/YkuD
MPVASIARRLQTARRLPVIGLFAASALFTAGAGAQPSLSPQQLTALMGAVTPWDDAYDLSSPGQQRVTTEQPMLTSGLADLTRGAVQRYQAIVNAGGWPTVPGGTTLRIGSVHPSVVILRERLRITGDLVPIGGDIMTFDSLVDAAVRRFQRRHGLNEDGVVGGETLTQLNVPATVRLAQLQANLDRVGSLPRPTAARYVVVNIPGAEIETVENGLIHSRHEAVVGQVERETPILSSAIHQINFHPYWTVPRSIIERDLIPLVQEDPNYLEDNLIGIYNWSTGAEIDPTSIDWTTNEAVDYLIRQEPSDINALGSVRINFHNP